MPTKGAFQKAVRLALVLLRCQTSMHWSSEDHEASHFALFSLSQGRRTCNINTASVHRCQLIRSPSLVHFHHKQRGSHLHHAASLENGIKRMRTAISRADYWDLLQSSERQGCTCINIHSESFPIPGLLWNSVVPFSWRCFPDHLLPATSVSYQKQKTEWGKLCYSLLMVYKSFVL